MIISASRRTDIPSYYGKWLVNRLRQGYALIQNPYDARRLSSLQLSPDIVDCIVFWTKNPAPMLGQLDIVSELGYSYYFQYTLTPYGKTWERNLPDVEKRIETLVALSERIGKQRVVWRYDPIIVDDRYSEQYHTEHFERLCEQLSPYVDQCIISFVDRYAHISRIVPEIKIETMRVLGAALSKLAAQYQLKLAACSEKLDLQKYGIESSSCIDKNRIERIIGCPIQSKKDVGQRPECGCVESVDLGAYGTCLNGCRYCYATKSQAAAWQGFEQHDPESPLLIGWPRADAVITEKTGCSFRRLQLSFLE